MSNLTSIEVRTAVPRDADALMGLIHALGHYQEEPADVTGNAGLLASHLWGERPVAEALVGLVGGEIVGFALYYTAFSTYLTSPWLYLADLFVIPDHRGTGLGKALLAHAAGVAVARGYERMEFTVLDWNELALGFYRRKGAVARTGWTNHRIAGEALRALAGEGERG